MNLVNITTKLRSAGCVFAEDEARLLICAADSPHELAAMIDRRMTGEPLEHVVGWAEFAGMRILLDPGVFVPRPRTELLVQTAEAFIRRRQGRSVLVELCCGSGAVSAALGRTFDDIELHAVDIDPAAVQCARRNIVGGSVYEGDLYDALPTMLQGKVDLLLANAPYVPTNAIAIMPQEARIHEPLIALDGGPDGLNVQRTIAAEAPRWLCPGGRLLIETSRQQASQTVDIIVQSGLSAEVVRADELDATVVVGFTSR
jgi:release factor glutamine methyltransferase